MNQDSSSDLKFIQLPNDETYAYRESGSSDKVLLLLHGNFTTSLFFHSFSLELSKHYRIISPDMRGYGHSTYKTPLTSIEDLCDDLKHFAEALKIHKFSLLGWSAGGIVAQVFASKYPSLVEKLILVASPGPRGVMMRNANGKLMKEKDDFLKCHRILDVAGIVAGRNKMSMKWFMQMQAFQMVNLPPEERLNKYVDEIFLQRNVIDMFYALNRFNISEENNGICEGNGHIRKIKAPCLLVHGSQDENVKCVESWELKRILGKKADIEILSGERHFLFEPKTAGMVAEFVKEFLNKEFPEEPEKAKQEEIFKAPEPKKYFWMKIPEV